MPAVWTHRDYYAARDRCRDAWQRTSDQLCLLSEARPEQPGPEASGSRPGFAEQDGLDDPQGNSSRPPCRTDGALLRIVEPDRLNPGAEPCCDPGRGPARPPTPSGGSAPSQINEALRAQSPKTNARRAEGGSV